MVERFLYSRLYGVDGFMYFPQILHALHSYTSRPHQSTSGDRLDTRINYRQNSGSPVSLQVNNSLFIFRVSGTSPQLLKNVLTILKALDSSPRKFSGALLDKASR